LAAELGSEVVDIYGIYIECRLVVQVCIGFATEFQGPLDEGRFHSTLSRAVQIMLVGGDHHHLFGL